VTSINARSPRPDRTGATWAAAIAVVKNEHSHRGQALRALVAALASGA